MDSVLKEKRTMRSSLSSRTRILVVAALVTCTFPVLQTAHAQAASGGSAVSAVTADINTAQVGEPVSPYIYGGFIEHIGPLIYRSLWSEMIDDRKFYFPISSKDAPPPSGN